MPRKQSHSPYVKHPREIRQLHGPIGVHRFSLTLTVIVVYLRKYDKAANLQSLMPNSQILPPPRHYPTKNRMASLCQDCLERKA